MKHSIALATVAAMLTISLSVAAQPSATGGANAIEQREHLIAAFDTTGVAAIPELTQALDSDIPLVRRTAAHLLVRLGKPALSGIEKALENPDFQVRRIAIHGLGELGLFRKYLGIILEDKHPSILREVQLHLFNKYVLEGRAPTEAIVAELAEVYTGASQPVRLNIVETVASFEPMSRTARRFLGSAVKDPDPDVQEVAFQIVAIPTIARMRELSQERAFETFIEEFGEEDLSSWPITPPREIGANQQASEASEAAYQRGIAFTRLGNGERAQQDLQLSIDRDPIATGRFINSIWRAIGANYRDNLNDPDRATAAFIKGFEAGGLSARGMGAFFEAVDVLRQQKKYDEALELLGQIDISGRSDVNSLRVVNHRADIYLALNQPAKAKQALEAGINDADFNDAQRQTLAERITEIQ